MAMTGAKKQADRRARIARSGYAQIQLFIPEHQRADWLGLGREVRDGMTIEAVVVRDGKTGRVHTIPLARL